MNVWMNCAWLYNKSCKWKKCAIRSERTTLPKCMGKLVKISKMGGNSLKWIFQAVRWWHSWKVFPCFLLNLSTSFTRFSGTAKEGDVPKKEGDFTGEFKGNFHKFLYDSLKNFEKGVSINDNFYIFLGI